MYCLDYSNLGQLFHSKIRRKVVEWRIIFYSVSKFRKKKKHKLLRKYFVYSGRTRWTSKIWNLKAIRAENLLRKRDYYLYFLLRKEYLFHWWKFPLIKHIRNFFENSIEIQFKVRNIFEFMTIVIKKISD